MHEAASIHGSGAYGDQYLIVSILSRRLPRAPRTLNKRVLHGGAAVKRTLSMSSNVVVAKDQVSSDLGGEVAILNLKAGEYYGLNAVGARIWNMIQRARTVEEIRDVLVSEYQVEPERCERDLIMLLQSLADAELIVVRDETPA
jgi:hypothetical protein